MKLAFFSYLKLANYFVLDHKSIFRIYLFIRTTYNFCIWNKYIFSIWYLKVARFSYLKIEHFSHLKVAHFSYLKIEHFSYLNAAHFSYLNLNILRIWTQHVFKISANSTDSELGLMKLKVHKNSDVVNRYLNYFVQGWSSPSLSNLLHNGRKSNISELTIRHFWRF